MLKIGAMDEDKIIEVFGLKISYSDTGYGKNILILHGWGSRHTSWIEVQRNLVKKGFRVIVPDLPGFGKSEEPINLWGLKEYSEFVREFAKVVNIEKYAIAGHSFGGRIAIDYSTRYPEDFKRLILISAAGVVRRRKIRTKILLIFTKIGNFVFSLPALSFARAYVTKIWYTLSGEKDYYRASHMMKAIMQKVLDEELKSYLPNIFVPTLILWGEKDVATPLSDGIIIHENIPKSSLHVFKGMPHALNFKNPDGIAEKIVEFLAT